MLLGAIADDLTGAADLALTLAREDMRALREDGFTRFLVAGGETSGAVVNSLGVNALRIGLEVDPGVPWTCSLGDEKPIVLALKSGNFGADDFFLKAWDHIG